MSSIVTPISRCSSDSPTQMIGLRPAASAAWTFLFTVMSVSPKYWRRSLWPMMTYLTSRSASMSAETSPVNAPDFSKYRFSAPTATRLSLNARTAAGTSTNGTHSTTSHHLVLGSSALNSSANALVSEGVLFIFQLPAMMVLRYLRFIIVISFLFIS